MYRCSSCIIVAFSPVTDFREATCRQYEENVCNRGGYCNFMHLKKISRELRRRLFGRNRRRQSRSRSRSQSPQKHPCGGYQERPHGGRGFGRRGGDDERDRFNDKNRRPRSRSPGGRRGRSRSPVSRRHRSPAGRESSAERRAKIELWNTGKRKQVDSGGKHDINTNNSNNNDEEWNGDNNNDQYYDPQQQQQ